MGWLREWWRKRDERRSKREWAAAQEHYRGAQGPEPAQPPDLSPEGRKALEEQQRQAMEQWLRLRAMTPEEMNARAAQDAILARNVALDPEYQARQARSLLNANPLTDDDR